MSGDKTYNGPPAAHDSTNEFASPVPRARPPAPPGARPPVPGQRPPGARPPGVSAGVRSPGAARSAKHKFWPDPPRSIEDLGIKPTMVEELILKAVFFAGEMRGSEICDRIKVPQTIVEEVIEQLRKQKYLDMKGSGMGVGRSGMSFQVTTFANDLLHQILDRNRYNGPAPVPLEHWIKSSKAQTVRGNRITRQKMEDKFNDLIITDYIFDGIGPAMNSGRAIFFFGAPGNGKTAICQCMVDCFENDIFIPHAILVDDFIIKIYDPTIHKRVEQKEEDPQHDERWVRIRRPLVVVGGELTMEMLDLTYSSEVKYYEAPFQMKATNGMLLIDDFGRQRVAPKDLLNRWIVPLESDVDYLTMHTGKKLQLPFDVFTAFSTNLDPADLVDDAFLRRVRYKLEVQRPDEDQFHKIWAMMCRKRGVEYVPEMVQYLIDQHYKPVKRPFAACQPRDLLDQMIDMSFYRGYQPQLHPDLFDAAVKSYFVKFDKDKAAAGAVLKMPGT